MCLAMNIYGDYWVFLFAVNPPILHSIRQRDTNPNIYYNFLHSELLAEVSFLVNLCSLNGN